jgi:uncharacterized protein involved in exopolysaccharide biosynthesis
MKTEETALDLYRRSSLPTARDIVAIICRQRRIILIAFILVVIAVAASGFWAPKYEAQMKILVRRQRSDEIVTASGNTPAQMFNDQVTEQDLNSEVELLNSDDLLRSVVTSTGLSGVEGAPTDHASEIKVAKAVRGLAAQLKITPGRKSNLVAVSYQSRDPKMTARVLSALGAAYFKKHLAVHRSNGELKFFDQQMHQYQQGLEQAQAKLTDFTQKTGVVDAYLERDSALRQATEFDTSAQQARSSWVETQRRVDALRAQLQSMKPRTVTVVRTMENPQLLEQLKSTLLNLELKRTELLSKFAPTYPAVQSVEQQIAETNRAISAEEIKPIREESSDRDPSYQWVESELAKSETDLSGLQSRAASAAGVSKRYREAAERLDKESLVQQDLLRTAKAQEENYLLYTRKREEARIGEALDQRGIVNVALAEEPLVPALPVRSVPNVIFMTLLFACVFSLSAGFVVDLLDPSFRTPDELANYLRIPVLAAMPKPKAYSDANAIR